MYSALELDFQLTEFTFSETKSEFYRQMKMLGMNFKNLEEKGLFKFIDLVTVPSATIQKEIDLLMSEIARPDSLRFNYRYIKPFGQGNDKNIPPYNAG